MFSVFSVNKTPGKDPEPQFSEELNDKDFNMEGNGYGEVDASKLAVKKLQDLFA